jgi:hypothetical protein
MLYQYPAPPEEKCGLEQTMLDIATVVLMHITIALQFDYLDLVTIQN